MNPRRPLGQHFLKNRSSAEKIVDWSGISRTDFVLEIGPGRGILTDVLRERSSFLYAVEVDPVLAADLRHQAGPAFEVEEADILNFDFARLDRIAPQWMAIGNLPYYVSTQIIQRIAVERRRFKSFTFMVQREVADRIAAHPNSKDYGYLACFCQLFSHVREGPVIPPGSFVPPPAVMSRVMKMEFLEQPRHPVADLDIWKHVVRAAFTQRRKTLLNNLKRYPALEPCATAVLAKLGLHKTVRAEQMTLQQLCNLANFFSAD